jgi:hypothetical protein
VSGGWENDRFGSFWYQHISTHEQADHDHRNSQDHEHTRDRVGPAAQFLRRAQGGAQAFLPRARPVDREGLDRIIRREPTQQDQAAFGGSILRVKFMGSLQAVQALLLGIHSHAQPDPIGGIFLVRFEQTRQQVARPGLFPHSQRLDGTLEHGVFAGFIGEKLLFIRHEGSVAQAGGWGKWNGYNFRMRSWLACLSVLLLLSACAPKTTATPVPAAPIPSPTLSSTATLTPTLIPSLTRIDRPTATAVTYTVVQGDTLIGIAQRNAVTLQALMDANPGISPSALPVGTKLVIPAGSQTPEIPIPTPFPLPVQQVRCWSELTGGLWCFALMQNDSTATLENLSAQFDLLDSSGQERASQTAYGLLDILGPGASMPLAVHFAPPGIKDARVRLTLLTAFRLLPGDTRYLGVRLENTLVSIDASGQTAQVSGDVLLTGAGMANSLWVLACAYDADGNVVGLRRWDAPAALTADAPLAFDFQVYSVGPGIARVEFLAEARP